MPAGECQRAERKYCPAGIERGENAADVRGKSRAQGGNGSGNADGKDHPAIKESDELSIRLADVDILPSRFREHRSHLRERKAGQHGNDHADGPDGEKQQRRAGVDGDIPGGKKNAGTDDPARQQHDGIKQ